MNKHLDVKTIELWTDGGIVIIFKDGSHTFIRRDQVKEIHEEIEKINLDEPF